MKTLLSNLLVLAAIPCLFSSCATLFSKTNQDVSFKGLPGTILVDKQKNKPLATIPDNGFATVSMKKQLAKKEVTASKEGYADQSFQVPSKISGAAWWNLLLGGVIGGAIDAGTGKLMSYKKDVVDVTLQNRLETAVEAPVTAVPDSKVDEPSDDMSSVILRWNIDSDPRGARVFYRVISSVPNEVKNTNEAYISTTPLEETRSFNIKGLTRRNASNVTIEIKVEKRDYETQIKRYNVGQAIDQQEISGFFELVKK